MGLAWIVLAAFSLPISSVDALWKRTFKGKRWLKVILIVVLVIAGFLSVPNGTASSTASNDITSETSKQNLKRTANQSKSSKEKKSTSTPTPSAKPTSIPTPTPVPTCDGTNITTACQVDGVMYNKYIYHPAQPAVTHKETKSADEQVISGYCTLCVDGTWSPSCATGRGACSHHGGVQQFNAPIYTTHTNTWQEDVIDTPAQDAYYETERAQ